MTKVIFPIKKFLISLNDKSFYIFFLLFSFTFRKIKKSCYCYILFINFIADEPKLVYYNQFSFTEPTVWGILFSIFLILWDNNQFFLTKLVLLGILLPISVHFASQSVFLTKWAVLGILYVGLFY